MTNLTKAVKIIQHGGVVAFPTETVYGLGADATNEQACLSIYRLKSRPAINPLIIHVNSLAEAKNYAIFNNYAEKLTTLWPGPLTMILPKRPHTFLAPCVTAGLDTVAIRISSHPILKQLIEKSGKALAAPSANKSGFLSSTRYEHVYEQFGKKITILGTNKEVNIGLESTIIDLSTNQPTILRAGFFTTSVLEKVLNSPISSTIKDTIIKSPGMLLGHYAPKTNIRLNAMSLEKNELGLNFANSQLISVYSLNLSPEGNLAEAAANLFAYLHQLDNQALKYGQITISIAPIPNEGLGVAINDRLSRAAQN